MAGMTERQIRRRENILSAARQLISEQGYEGVTIRDLAALSGVAPKTLYRHFGNKEDLLRSAVEERFRYLYLQIDAAKIDRGIDRLFYILDSVKKTTQENAAYARALAPILREASSTTFTLIRMNTYRRAIEQIAQEGELEPWVNPRVLNALIFRQVNPVYFSSLNATTSNSVAYDLVRLNICLLLASVTNGYTHARVLELAQELQAELKDIEFV